MKVIHTILQSEIFTQKPPVLIDIGASDEINGKWKIIAPYSICLAFDADDRDFVVTEQVNKTFKKLITFNRIVTAQQLSNPPFYLTASPHCSSLLKPDDEKLKPWIFSSLFQVERKISLPSITLAEALQQVNVDYIDWFKTDSQGTDLRLFKSLSESLSNHVLAAEFEPGILDAYQGEDKLYMVMEEMQKRDFWLSSMETKGIERLSGVYADHLGPYIKKGMVRKSPGWAEVTYLKLKATDKRELLLLYVFALLERQYGFAVEIADHAIAQKNDSLFVTCREEALKKIRSEKSKLPLVFVKRKIRKLLSGINE